MSNAFDSTNYPTVEPASLVIGDRWAWKRTNLTDYAPASYTLTYEAIQKVASTPASFTVTASGSGTDFVVEVASATTAGYEPGEYAWRSFITRTSDGERIALSHGSWTLVANFATSEADPRSHNQRTLDLIEAMIEGHVVDDVQSYSIGGRQMALMSGDELRGWKNYYQARVWADERRDRAAQGLAHNGTVRVTF